VTLTHVKCPVRLNISPACVRSSESVGSHLFPFGVHSLMGVRERLGGSVWTWSSASLLAAAPPASQPTTQPCQEHFPITRPCMSAPATTSSTRQLSLEDLKAKDGLAPWPVTQERFQACPWNKNLTERKITQLKPSRDIGPVKAPVVSQLQSLD